MSKQSLQNLHIRLGSLAVFRQLLCDPVIRALKDYLGCIDCVTVAEGVSKYARLVSCLYETGGDSLAGYIRSIVGDNENPYIVLVGKGEKPSEQMENCVWQELATLQAAADLTPQELGAAFDWQGFLPEFKVEKVDIPGDYRQRCKRIGEFGYGIYARHRMFYINSEGKIVPVLNPDKTRLASLVDYKREQKIIMDNTVALLEGKPAANILLTGDAGTGKSSTVKAVVNELYQRGLRILEVRKEQLTQIPEILDTLNSNPLKFILFIDDLSFQKDDDNFSALKAILEGSVSAKSQNVAIYATSNRRHLVKESFSDRDGDDIHRNDTMQEIISLSERFGIQITFTKPDKQTYLDIVHHLARERGVDMDIAELDKKAEAFALSRGGRSARAANQFLDNLISQG